MLASEDLQMLIQRGESKTLEFKRTTSELESAMRTVSGLLNSGSGGYVAFGVGNDGRIHGMTVAEQTLHDVAHSVRQIEPAAGLRVETVPVSENRSVIVLAIPTSTRLHTYRGVAYRRIGNTTERMPFEALERRLVEQAHRGFSWESVPSGFTMDDLDHDEIVRTVNEAVRRQRLRDLSTGATVLDRSFAGCQSRPSQGVRAAGRSALSHRGAQRSAGERDLPSGLCNLRWCHRRCDL